MPMCMCMCDCMVHVRVCAVEIACMQVVSGHAGTQVGSDASGRAWPCEGMARRLVPSALCVGSRASAALGAMARVAPPYHASTGATSRQARRFSSANIAERPVGVGLGLGLALGLGLGLGSGLGSGLGLGLGLELVLHEGLEALDRVQTKVRVRRDVPLVLLVAAVGVVGLGHLPAAALAPEGRAAPLGA